MSETQYFCNVPLDPWVSECGSTWAVGWFEWEFVQSSRYGKRGIWTLGPELMWPCEWWRQAGKRKAGKRKAGKRKAAGCCSGNISTRQLPTLLASIIQPPHATLFWRPRAMVLQIIILVSSNNGGVLEEEVLEDRSRQGATCPDIQSKTSASLTFPEKCTVSRQSFTDWFS